MAPDDTPNGPSGQTVGTDPNQADAAPPTNDPTALQDPLKLAAQTRLAADLKNASNLEEVTRMIGMGVNPNMLNSLGGNALGLVTENADASAGLNQSLLKMDPTVTAPTPDPAGKLFLDADGGVTTDRALADPLTPTGQQGPQSVLSLVRADGIDAAAVIATAEGLPGAAFLSNLVDNQGDNQNLLNGVDGGSSVFQQAAATGINPDGTIADVSINTDAPDPSGFQYGTDADNIGADAFAPTPPSYDTFADSTFADSSMSTMSDFNAPPPITFSDKAMGMGNTLPDLSLFAETPPVVTLAAATPTDGTVGATPATAAPAVVTPDPAVEPDPAAPAALAVASPVVTTPAVVTPDPAAGPDPFAIPATLAVASPAVTVPAVVTPDPAAGPDPFTQVATLAADTALLDKGLGLSSSFVGKLGAYSPPEAAAAVPTLATTFGDLSGLNNLPANPSVYGTSFFNPVSVASAIIPPANDSSAPTQVVAAAAPRVQTSMSMS